MPFSRNPIATVEQAETELEALEIAQHPLVQRTRDDVRQYWLEKARPSTDMRSCFDWAFDEVMYCAAVWSLNHDPQYPRVVTTTRLPHQLGDVAIPGSRYGVDNPDTIYRVIPIDGNERYLIRGRVPPRRLVENYFALWDGTFNSGSVFNGKNIVTEADGSFTLTVNSDPLDGRPNHIQSTPASREFFIRDVIADWSLDTPNILEIEKLGPPTRAPRTREEKATLAARFMHDFVNHTMRWNAPALERPPNLIDFSIDRDTDGALRNQFYHLGHFRIDDDDALILTLHIADAQYFVVPITNIWGTTNDIIQRTASLNKAQSVPNHDGTYTFVISMRDPGVYNWVDPCDLHEGIITARWAEFPEDRPCGRVAAETRLVKLDELGATLPAETRFVTPQERKLQLSERERGYLRRLADG